eukprot:Protomagalhaensia_sp_Gyna_25__1320@NODE_1663_length_1648_cov_902_433810_g1361_i0_p2_GENE_NODE_1663_length_1648_cov_902_433810_g1361_i0NODE_1663_length_1648_cov_902_433810_g1361_i0_p2_ORF_typecomplete_len124_score15_33_NODE_1663_length_1648_cov_902_433810_g1361_i0263634
MIAEKTIFNTNSVELALNNPQQKNMKATLPEHPDQSPERMVPRRSFIRVRRRPTFTYDTREQLWKAVFESWEQASLTPFTSVSKSFLAASGLVAVVAILGYVGASIRFRLKKKERSRCHQMTG